MTDSQVAETSSWLNRYASNYHAWRMVQDRHGAVPRWYRPLGLVESGFDNDGLYFEGRADINVALSLTLQSSLSKRDFRQRFLYAWTVLRLRHGLLMAKIMDHQAYMDTAKEDRCFVVEGSANAQEALMGSARHLVFTDDHYDHIDIRQFYKHAQNVKRIIDPAEALSKLFVVATPNDKKHPLHLLFVFSHTISDALTNHAWTSHFVQLVNLPLEHLKAELERAIDPTLIIRSLPPAQEDLYPSISGSIARRRWYWAITRILRHVRKPMPQGFGNPLSYPEARLEVAKLEPKYSHLFDYHQLPPLNTYTVGAKLSKRASQRLQRICTEKKVSVGAGCFTLIALVMMDIYERDAQQQGPTERHSYIVGFPVNPRPFLKYSDAPNSLMLAFGDGFSLPFLASQLGNAKRFAILVRQMHRNLSAFQKRDWRDAAHLKTYMSSRGAGRVIANTYIGSAERRWNTLPENMRRGMSYMEPQGQYPVVASSISKSTNGVSSFGKLSWPDKQEVQDTDFKAVCTGLTQGVRARAGEFLVAIWGEDGRICANVSYDGNAIDELRTAEWQIRMEQFLEEPEYHL